MTINLDAWNNSLAGDVAFDLFTSDDAFPLHDWVAENKAECNPAWLIAVIACYADMVRDCRDGRYHGHIRNVVR